MSGTATDIATKDENSKSKKKEKDPVIPFFALWKYATVADMLFILVGLASAAVVGVAQPYQMVLFADLMDVSGLQMSDMKEKADQIFNVYVVFSLIVGACGWIYAAALKMSAARQAAHWRKAYLRAILRQDVTWFDVNNPQELPVSIAERTQLIEEALGDKLGMGVRSFTGGIGGIVLAFYYKWDMSLILLATMPLAGVGVWLLQKVNTVSAGRLSAAYEKAGGIVMEFLSQMRTVASLSLEDTAKQRYSDSLEPAQKALIWRSGRVGFANALVFASGNIMSALSLLYGGWVIAKQLKETEQELNEDAVCGIIGMENGCGDLLAMMNQTLPMMKVNCYYHNYADYKDHVDECPHSGGDLFIAMFALQIGAQSLGIIEPSITAIAKARAAAYKIVETVKRVPVIDIFNKQLKTLSQVTGNITFTDVDFCYPTRPDTMVSNKLNLDIKGGSTVALVGHSGCGKSTVVQLLERFYDPAGGSVTLDGTDIRELQTSWLRAQIGYVTQEPVLFTGTIEENIRNGNMEATKEDVIEAAKSANAHDFIEELSEKYATEISGSELSGGQKQRIAIARAMIKKPSILLLDEATSALDNESERHVQAALDKLIQAKGMTTIVIAHRLTTIMNADKIVVMEKGAVVEQGTHKDLLDVPDGAYAKLWKAANKAGDDDDDEGEAKQTKLATTEVKKEEEEEEKKEKDMTKEEKKAKKRREAAKKKEEAKQFAGITKKIWGLHTAQDYPYFVLGVIGALIGGAVNPFTGYVYVKAMGVFYGIKHEDVWSEAVLWCWVMLVGAVAQCIGEVFRFYGFGVPSARMTTELRKKLFSATIKQEIGWFDMPAQDIGNLSSRLSEGVTLIPAFTGEQRCQLVFILGTLIVGFFLAFYLGFLGVGLVCLGLLPAMGAGMSIEMMVWTGQGEDGAAGVGARASQLVSEVVKSIRTVASLNMEDKFMDSFDGALTKHLKAEQPKTLVKSSAIGFSQFILLFGTAVMLKVGIDIVETADDEQWYHLPHSYPESKCPDKPECSMERFERFMIPIMVIFMIAAGMGQAASAATDIAKAKKAAVETWEVIDRKSKIDHSSGEGTKISESGDFKGAISFSNVEFAYPRRPNATVCKGVSVEVEAGTTVAFVGQSGSGKSTVVQLIERFYDPAQGQVSIDGASLDTLNVTELRKKISMVGQEPVLFNGSIKENIRYGKQGATDEEVIAAAQMANLHDDVMNFESKYDTECGNGTSQLSGGQKQRVAIARAMISRPQILLLDEATSALDNVSEQVVQQALDKLMASVKCTTIVIAHRLTTIQNADKIVVMQKGQVVEEGTHSQLMKIQSGYYAKLQARSS